MVTVIFGVVVLALLLMALNAFARANPRTLVPVVKMVGGVGALGGAAFLAARGQFGIAIPLGFAGLGLWDGCCPARPESSSVRARAPGQVSRVRSPSWRWSDHDSGDMRGRILAGHTRASLDVLDVKTLTGFLAEIDEEPRATDRASDRRVPAGVTMQADAAAGRPARRGQRQND